MPLGRRSVHSEPQCCSARDEQMKQKKRERYAKSLCLHAVAAAVLLLRLCIDLDGTAENSSACTDLFFILNLDTS